MSDQPNDLLAARRAKLERIRAQGVDPFPHDFPGVTAVAEVQEPWQALEAGEERDDAYRIAGRLSARRGQGKMAFLDIVDRSGRMQVQARADVLGEDAMAQLVDFDLGDLVGIDGTIFASRSGELTLKVTGFTLLAKSLRPPPDKHHGLQDVETRYRRRELDLIANEEARELFAMRAKVVSTLRRALDDDGFIEVETPVLQPLYGGALARPFVTHHNSLDRDLYLRIATELYLKRCIVGGLERVYELGKDFRNEGLSTKHNPEFTMVEWYEAYADYGNAMDRVEEIVISIAAAISYDGPYDFSAPWPRVPLAQAIKDETGIDITANADRESLVAAIAASDKVSLDVEDRPWPSLVDDLLSKYVEPKVTNPIFITDYPVELSPFAKSHRSEEGLVERFEAFCGGMEFANAFSELNDPDEQRRRFDDQVRLAEEGDDESQPYDELFVQALEQGMPPTAGVGLGIDRLVMMMSGRDSIREVVLFPAMRD
ncbi:MAG: lysine--tRNA ligase [Actinobacteria bacterium]|uniref:lysine--tRNA ligase n=1 Tax=freshwater metagenome TaxID=449393 RepID=A0A6J5ZU51_9ZZZZ|nr:lysine--tRNA ligase [Actinomycetota bacterium]